MAIVWKDLDVIRLSGEVREISATCGRCESGSIAPIFAIAGMFAMMVIAIAVDFGRSEMEFQRVQRAADSAALAASHRLGTADQDVSGREVAEKFFRANIEYRSNEAIEQVIIDAERGEVKILAGGHVGTSLLNAFGLRSNEIRAASKVVKGDGTVEVALVLDNSGSMAGQPIADLATASRNLVNVVFTGATQSDRVKVAVVPFSGAVNVGGEHRDAAWMDSSGVSPLNGQNFAMNIPRFEMFDKLNTAWRGCVEGRADGLDVTDTTPNTAVPNTLFVPMFAPDEPDSNNDDGNSYSNSYIADDGGSCTPQPTTCTSYNRRGQCTNWQKTPLAANVAQARVCKYDNAVVPTGSRGPNANCESESMLALTDSRSEIDAKLSTMIAKGYTNIAEGMMWGWRALSPEAPFPEGRPYDTRNNQKIVVLMTDGANTYPTASNHNRSIYLAHGYGSSGRLGTNHAQSAYVARMNSKTAAACANAKAAGIKIYTVAFRLENEPTTLSLLQGCASEASMAFRASDGAALALAFERIGTEISKLRVAG